MINAAEVHRISKGRSAAIGNIFPRSVRGLEHCLHNLMFSCIITAACNKLLELLPSSFHLDHPIDWFCLVLFSADIDAVTKGENQTAMHYASKNNATASLKALLNLGAQINARDYKMRTPLFVAAESGIHASVP